MTRFARLDVADYALPQEVAAELASPALVVHMDKVRENLRRVLALLGGDAARWRPHVKTTKLPAVWAELARAGIRHFKCATTREARVLAELLEAEGVAGADVLLAYPLVGPALAELGRVATAHPGVRVSVLCEEPTDVAQVPDGVELFVDLNPGMDRTGVPMDEGERVLAIARAAGSRLRGLHYYDGHRHEEDLELRRALAFDGYERLLELLDTLRSAGARVEELITSGTPAFLCALAYEPFRELDGVAHRVSPGTVVFHDLRSERENPGLDLLPAAVVFARVSSRPRADVVTCDAGSKSIAAEAGDPVAFVLGHPELAPLSPSEEHLPLRVLRGPAPARGTELHLVPRHVCPTVNLAEAALLLDPGHPPRLAPVTARAHPLQYGARGELGIGDVVEDELGVDAVHGDGVGRAAADPSADLGPGRAAQVAQQRGSQEQPAVPLLALGTDAQAPELARDLRDHVVDRGGTDDGEPGEHAVRQRGLALHPVEDLRGSHLEQIAAVDAAVRRCQSALDHVGHILSGAGREDP